MAEEAKKLYSKEKIGVTVMLILLTAAIFLAIGFWAGSKERASTESTITSVGTPPIPDEPIVTPVE